MHTVTHKQVVREITCKQALRIECYRSINKVPPTAWETFARRDAVGLEMGHLRAVEESRINDMHPYYFIGFEDNRPVGIAYCFAIKVNLAEMAGTYPSEVLATVKAWQPDFMDARVLEVGHIASLGKTIEVLRIHKRGFISALSDAIDEVARIENADLCFIRDIEIDGAQDFSLLEKRGYVPVTGFPVARMPVEWRSFDGYLSALKSKRRYNIRKKREKLDRPEIRVEIIDDYAPYAARLSELWENVAKRNNGYEHEKLTPAFFEAMSFHLAGRSHVVAIKRYDQIVAYGLNLIGDDEYFGMAEGIDYDVRDEYDLYANNIFEGLRVSCDLEKKAYNIGITAYEFKTFIGAELEPRLYFVKACKKAAYTKVFADFFRKLIKPPDNQHYPFRERDTSKRIQLSDINTRLRAPERPLDPFTKHLRYTRVDAARSADLYTYCPVFESAQEPIIKHRKRDVIMLGTNSYLGISNHPAVIEAMRKAIDKYGSGCSGSPLLNGTLDLHSCLADRLARFTNKQDALIFSTGYQTNVGVVSALVNRDDVLVMDARSHASLIDGARLAGAAFARYRHNDMKSLESVLSKYSHRPKLVITDSLFSMEGTMVDLPAIVKLVKRYDARLMLDESHAIGVLGDTGRGVAEYYGLLDEVDIIMGTFSKSFASIGGFVSGEREIIDTLKHTARSHIFSASLPPSAVAAVLAAIDIIDDEPERRTRLLSNAKFLATGLQNLGYSAQYRGGAIIPVHCGHELLALAAFRKLFDEGVFVNPVTYPAVPAGQEMLRISLMATHDETMLLRALDAFSRVKTANWPAAASGYLN